MRRAAIAQAAGVAVSTVLLLAYANSADSYVNDGTSRWDAHGGKALILVAVCLGPAAAAALLVASRRGSALALAFMASAFVAVFQVIATVALTAD